MKILQLHNRYQFTGGEEMVVQAEKRLLETHGHAVTLLEVDNASIQGRRNAGRAAVAAIYSRQARCRVEQLLAHVQPDIVHVHNFFPLLSPAVYDACASTKVPVVQTLHNYRLICPNALCFRDGHPCEDCVGKPVPWPGVLHACYRHSRPASAAVAAMLTVHRLRGTWQHAVSAYIALTEFARTRFVQGGLPEDRIVVKPNFVAPTPPIGRGSGGFALCAGRLSEEKGTRVLLAAWEHLDMPLPLWLAGDGPLAAEVMATAKRVPSVIYKGRLSQEQVLELMREATMLIVPSLCYENFPMAIVEAYASGLPVIVSDVGSVAGLVDPGRTGLRFRAGDTQDLAVQVHRLATEPSTRSQMRAAARAEFERHYTAESNYQLLMHIYQQAIDHARGTSNLSDGHAHE